MPLNSILYNGHDGKFLWSMHFVMIIIIVQVLRIWGKQVIWVAEVLLCLEFPCKGQLAVTVSQRGLCVPALLSSRASSWRAIRSGRDVVSLPPICPCLERSPAGLQGHGGGCRLRLPTMDGPRA